MKDGFLAWMTGRMTGSFFKARNIRGVWCVFTGNGGQLVVLNRAKLRYISKSKKTCDC